VKVDQLAVSVALLESYAQMCRWAAVPGEGGNNDINLADLRWSATTRLVVERAIPPMS
jgi:hypothetical protein